MWLRDPPTLADILRLDDEELRAEVLARAAPALAPEDVPDAVAAALAMGLGDNVATALGPLVARLPADGLDPVLDKLLRRNHSYAFYRRTNGRGWVWLVDLIAPPLSVVQLSVALRAARRRRDDDAWRGWSITTLVPYLAPSGIDEAIEAVQRLNPESMFQRDAALSRISRWLAAASLIDRALETLDQIRESRWMGEALDGLIEHLPDDAAQSRTAAVRQPDVRAGLLLATAEHRTGTARVRLIDQALAELRDADDIPAATLRRAATLAAPERLPAVLSLAAGS